MNKKILIFLVSFGIILRLFLSIITYHTDLGAFALAGKYIAGEGKWLSFYDTIASKDDTGKLIVHRTDMIFNYQPLAYLIPSVIYLPFSGIVRETGELLINRNWVESFSSSINFTLLLYKLPMLLADIAILWLLPKFFTNKKQKNAAILLWAFNPIAIYVSSIMGQVDIIIAFLILASLYFARKEKLLHACVFVALSALIKPIGLILIPVYAIYQFQLNRNLFKSALVATAGVATYVLGVIPYIGSASYRHYALFAEQINKSTYASISIASGHDIPFFFVLLALTVLLFWSKRITLIQTVTAVLLSSLAFTHFHPQWLVWLMPLIILESININDYFVYIVSILCWFGVLFSFDATLHLQMFVHSSLDLPTALTTSNMFKELIQISRAGIIAILIWLFVVDYPQNKKSI